MQQDGDAPVYLVLGATGGVGAALCRRLSQRGARLVLGARREAPLLALAAELNAEAVPCDAARPGDVDRVVGLALERFGRLDGVACCVGSLLLKPAHLTTPEQWDETLAANLTSAFGAVRAGARAMMRGGGSIVLVSSAAARVGLPNHEAIAAAKAGVIGLALSAAATYARYRVRVNCVAPGLVRTPLTAGLTGNSAMLAASTAMHPLGRIGEPEEVAAAIAWLLDPAQGWITGQVLGVDGGLGSLRPPVQA